MTSWQAPDHGEPLDPGYAGPPGGGQAAYPPAYPVPPGYQPYGAPYPQYGYPQYGYPAYGYPPRAPGDLRPGLVTASAVLAFVLSGLLILAGLLLFLGASIAADVEDAFNSGTHIGLELTLDAVVNLVAAGLLIAGGVSLLGRNLTSRILLSAGGGIVVAAAIYWLTRFDDISSSGWTFDAALFLILTVLVLAFTWTTPVTRWLRRTG